MAPLPQPLTVKKVKLGSQGFEVSKQGLGCMGMSAFYGPPKPERDMIELIRHAASRGITFLDTSDVYGPHTNEILVGKVHSCPIASEISSLVSILRLSIGSKGTPFLQATRAPSLNWMRLSTANEQYCPCV